MKKLLFILLFSPLFAFAQTNLVPNPSFEFYSTCPDNQNQVPFAVPWFNPTWGTPDYFNQCFSGPSPFIPDVPQNSVGIQIAQNGVAYSGIGIAFGANVREYIEVKLTDSLIAGKKYCVEFYVSLAGSSKFAIANIGAYFSDSIFSTDVFYLPYSPQVSNPASLVISDTVNWTVIADTFIAIGGEEFITIGNFYDDASTNMDTAYPGNVNNLAYYYIDNVSVKDCGWSGINEEENNFGISVYPNPSNGKFTLSSETTKGAISIYNVQGEKIYQSIIQTSQSSIDLSTQPKGIYFVRVQTEKGVASQKLIIQ